MNSGQTAITFIAADNSLSGPLRKQMFAAKRTPLWVSTIDRFQSVLFVSYFQGSLNIVKNVVVSYRFQFPRSGVIQKACTVVRFYEKLCLL